MKKKSLILFSGGIDSYVAMALEKQSGAECVSLSFEYAGQPDQEIRAIREISAIERVPNYIVRHPVIIGAKYGEKPVQFIPDNLVYYSMAIAFSRNNKISRIIGGQNKDDSVHATDAKNMFYEGLNKIIVNNYPDSVLEIVQPLLNMTKLEVVEKGLELNLPLELTWSCQNSGHKPCIFCSNCRSREEISKKLGVNL
ncbi:hypothetical protein COV11_02245 [Candidatus Woesearchaeota archaeon CG10_big_fil_rev_8_21_14_0_10_30_7]|nr:MAG: hypothetical protein COV11_02245 [Candidatus Woesearchaeota archaeon CG10_big_fil_rev_8_21_14_0_10_30_7]